MPRCHRQTGWDAIGQPDEVPRMPEMAVAHMPIRLSRKDRSQEPNSRSSDESYACDSAWQFSSKLRALSASMPLVVVSSKVRGANEMPTSRARAQAQKP